MKKNIFGKKRQKQDGRTFYTFLTILKNKSTGEEMTVEVKFREECGNPKKLPCVIEFDKKDANYSEKIEKYADTETGEEKETIRKVLWISKYKESEYIDESLNDFE